MVNGKAFDDLWPEEASSSVELTLNRFGREVTISLERGAQLYFEVYQVAVDPDADKQATANFEKWLSA